jgi:arylsulfatase A-like enzyme
VEVEFRKVVNLSSKSVAWLAVGSLAALVVGYLPFGALEAEGPPRNVLLISIDTLRADHCGFLGYDKPTTPFLDGLADRGVVFENHMVHSNNTLLSHASILTGLPPQAHDTYDNGAEASERRALGPGYRTLAEAFQGAGYTTAAFTGHPVWLGSDFGLDQGFDVHESGWVMAPETSRRFLSWYDETRPKRMFCFLHFYDVHSEAATNPDSLPYDSSPELIERFAGPRPEGWTGRAKGHPDYTASRYLNMVTYGLEKLGTGHLEYVIGLYDAGLRKLDDDLAALFGQLERRRVLRDALVIVTSDHGEAFLEHGQMLHGTFHDEIMHVPLMLVPPQRYRVFERRVDDVSRAIDISATLLDFIGADPIGRGNSLLPAILQGAPLEDAEVFFDPADVLRGQLDGTTYKFCDGQGFFDLDADPLELDNRLSDPAMGQRIAVLRERQRDLLEWAHEYSAERQVDGPVQVEALSSDLEALRALAYVD